MPVHGYPSPPTTDSRPRIRTGVERFERLSPETQRKILGPAKYRAYRAGALQLSDVIGFRVHPRWGPVGWERSLRDILGSRADEWLEAAD